MDWYNPLRWALAIDEKAPVGFLPIAHLEGWVQFPFRDKGSVRAFELGGFKLDLPPCSVIADDGTLCSDVVLPGRVLSHEQRDRLESLLNHGFGVSRSGGCTSYPAAAFVWYDDDEHPVAHLTLEGECLAWHVAPAPAGLKDGRANSVESERDVFSSLCKELGFERCSPNEGHSNSDRAKHPEQDLAQRVLQAALRADFGVPAATLLTRTTPVERRRLCAWLAMAAQFSVQAAGFVLPKYDTSFKSDNGGSHIRVLGFMECVRRIPECKCTVGEAQQEARHVLNELSIGKVTAPLKCRVGIEELSARE